MGGGGTGGGGTGGGRKTKKCVIIEELHTCADKNNIKQTDIQTKPVHINNNKNSPPPSFSVLPQNVSALKFFASNTYTSKNTNK